MRAVRSCKPVRSCHRSGLDDRSRSDCKDGTVRRPSGPASTSWRRPGIRSDRFAPSRTAAIGDFATSIMQAECCLESTPHSSESAQARTVLGSAIGCVIIPDFPCCRHDGPHETPWLRSLHDPQIRRSTQTARSAHGCMARQTLGRGLALAEPCKQHHIRQLDSSLAACAMHQ